MKKTLAFLATLTVVLFGCKKSENKQPDKSSESYQPVTQGTYWKYNTGSSTSVRTMTGETAVFKGKTYYKFTAVYSNGGTQTGYYGQQNGDYFLYEVVSGVGENELLYLKENAAVGETWTHDIATTPNGYKHRVKGKIIDKNITHVVVGKTYNNVIHTQLITQSSPPASDVYNDVQTLNYYIAKGIGIIDAAESLSPGIKLTEYVIK